MPSRRSEDWATTANGVRRGTAKLFFSNGSQLTPIKASKQDLCIAKIVRERPYPEQARAMGKLSPVNIVHLLTVGLALISTQALAAGGLAGIGRGRVRGRLRIVVLPAIFASMLSMAVPALWYAGSVTTDRAGPASHREIVDIDAYPWLSLGKIGNSAGGQCTGAVIGSNQVLTAAHCLYNIAAGRFISAGSIHFLLGYVRDQYRVHRVASRYIVPPTFNAPSRTLGPVVDRADDWAILYFDEGFSTDITPLRMATMTPLPGTAVKIGGYARERLYMMTVDPHCRILQVFLDGKLIAHDCVTQQGDSGGPLLSGEKGEEGLIVGVNVWLPKDLEKLDVKGVSVSAASITEFLASQVVGSVDGPQTSKLMFAARH